MQHLTYLKCAWEEIMTRMSPGDINKSKVKIKDEVDYDTPGSYEITYSVKSGKSRTGTVRLIVIVTE